MRFSLEEFEKFVDYIDDDFHYSDSVDIEFTSN